jgi:hypothetical protein
MVYTRTLYVVNQDDNLADGFKTLIGVLTDELASPTLHEITFPALHRHFWAPLRQNFCRGTTVCHLHRRSLRLPMLHFSCWAIFTSLELDVLSQYFLKKASKTRNVVNGTFAADY